MQGNKGIVRTVSQQLANHILTGINQLAFHACPGECCMHSLATGQADFSFSRVATIEDSHLTKGVWVKAITTPVVLHALQSL